MLLSSKTEKVVFLKKEVQKSFKSAKSMNNSKNKDN